MTKRSPLSLTLSGLLVAFVAFASWPALAAAATIKVDDNRVQCPLAEFTTLTAAVAAAANGDTIHVCAGTYTVPSGSPSSGLRIEKNLTIEGAGAGKVFVQPATEPGTSLASEPPNPRDEYGNIITVRRRLIELTDVSISGLTVRAANIPVEAGIAMIDVDTGKLSGVVVEGIVPAAGPGTGAYEAGKPLATQGQGIIVANTIEATDDTTTITGSEVKGFNATGILVDNRLLDGSGSVGNESHVTAKVLNTRITGAGTTSPIAQTGIEGWGSGARLTVADSRIGKVGKADGSAAAVALHGIDVADSVVGGSEEDAVNLTEDAYGITNQVYGGTAAAATTLDATHNFWGTPGTTPSPLVGPKVAYAPVAETAPPATAVAVTPDAAPTLQWDSAPAEGTEVKAGVPLHLAVTAEDDFGVTRVEFRLGGTLLGVAPTPALAGERLYAFDWTPTAEQVAQLYGADRQLTAVAVDSAANTAQLSVGVDIKGPPRLSTAAGAIAGKVGGYAAVGEPLGCEGGDASYPAATLSYAWTVDGIAAGTGPTYVPAPADQGKSIVCTVTATNEFGTRSQAGGPVLVAELPRLTGSPTISGNVASYAVSGETLTCSAGAAATNPTASVTYTWLRDGAAVGSGPTYTVTTADELHGLACQATGSSAGGSTSLIAPIEVGGAPRGGSPALGGTGEVGSTLTCEPGTWSAVPTASVAIAWLRDGAPIGGAVGTTYKVVSADAGAALSCQVTATNALGSATATSPALKIAPTPPVVTPPSTTIVVKGGKVTPGGGKLTGAKAVVGSVSCEVGPCTIKAPKKVKVKIAGKTYVAALLAPRKLASGASADLVLKLPVKARRALAAAGHSAKLSFTVSVTGGGATDKETISLKLVAAGTPR